MNAHMQISFAYCYSVTEIGEILGLKWRLKDQEGAGWCDDTVSFDPNLYDGFPGQDHILSKFHTEEIN